MRHSIMTVTALAATLALSGCGGSKSASSGDGGSAVASTGGSDLDPCSILTSAEMTAITTDVVTRQDRDGATCNYRNDPKDGLQLTVYATGGAAQMKIRHQTTKLLGGMGASVANMGGAGADVSDKLKADTSAAPAIGDEAVWQMNDTLAVRKGDAFVEVSPMMMHDPATHTGYPLVSKADKRAIAQAVATKVLAKLAS